MRGPVKNEKPGVHHQIMYWFVVMGMTEGEVMIVREVVGSCCDGLF